MNASTLTLSSAVNSIPSNPPLTSSNNHTINISELSSGDNRKERVDVAPADFIVNNECPVCLLPITASTLARLAACPHVFHDDCIHVWHNTRLKNGLAPNCPSCRKFGPLTPAWPSFDFYRSFVFGPSGILTVLPHLLIIRTHYAFSPNTKQIIRFVDIKRLVRKRNYIYLYDHSDQLIFSFRPYQLLRFLQELVQNIKQHNTHINNLLQNEGSASSSISNRASMFP